MIDLTAESDQQKPQTAEIWKSGLELLGTAFGLLTAIGYLSLRTHLNTIGITTMVPLSPTRYVMEIAEIFAAVLGSLLYLFYLMFPIALLVSLGLIVPGVRRKIIKQGANLLSRVGALLWRWSGRVRVAACALFAYLCVISIPFILPGNNELSSVGKLSDMPLPTVAVWQFNCFVYAFVICIGSYKVITSFKKSKPQLSRMLLLTFYGVSI